MVAAFFRHGSNALLVGGASCLLAAGALGGPKPKPARIVLGALLFFASEYSTHRFVLHAEPSNHAFVRGLQRRLHYDHHVDPARLDLLFLPPWALIPSLGVCTAVYAALTRDPDTVASLALGNLLGLISYEWVHYVAHIPYKPKTRYGRYIKKYHLWHHFKNEKLWYGVTNPTLDRFGGTYRDVADVERSATTRDLFPEGFQANVDAVS